MQLRAAFGVVALKVWRGKNPVNGRWGIPIRERWGLIPHQQLSPALEDVLAYFATVAGSYELAARLAGKVGIVIEDSTIEALVQRLGARAQTQTQDRLRTVPVEKHPERPASELAVVIWPTGFRCAIGGLAGGSGKRPNLAWNGTNRRWE